VNWTLGWGILCITAAVLSLSIQWFHLDGIPRDAAGILVMLSVMIMPFPEPLADSLQRWQQRATPLGRIAVRIGFVLLTLLIVIGFLILLAGVERLTGIDAGISAGAAFFLIGCGLLLAGLRIGRARVGKEH